MPNQQVNNPESGLRNHRVEFIRENDVGVTPTDPTIEQYSDTVTNVSWASDATNEPRRGLGNADPTGFIRGPESHEVTVTYDLVQWFTDGSGNAQDASYDGMTRDADQLLPNTHTFIDREDKGAVKAENTVSGNTSYSTRIYTVGRGGAIDEVTVTGDPSDSQPVTIELSYVFQKVRTYQIDQMDTATEVVVKSTDSGDTTQTVTIEGEDDTGSFTTEDVSLNGNTIESGSTVFQSIDAAHLDAECAGDVTIAINDGTTASPTEGDTLMEIAGSTSYNDVEGDIGVPGKGANGTRNSLTNQTPETFLGDVIKRGGSPSPHEIQTMTITVSNNIETVEVSERLGMSVFPANRNIEIEASMYGENATHDLLTDHLQNNSEDIDWEMDGGTMTLVGAVLTDPGDRAAEEGQAVMTTDNTFSATDINFS